jgi:hypothetical protein
MMWYWCKQQEKPIFRDNALKCVLAVDWRHTGWAQHLVFLMMRGSSSCGSWLTACGPDSGCGSTLMGAAGGASSCLILFTGVAAVQSRNIELIYSIAWCTVIRQQQQQQQQQQLRGGCQPRMSRHSSPVTQHGALSRNGYMNHYVTHQLDRTSGSCVFQVKGTMSSNDVPMRSCVP